MKDVLEFIFADFWHFGGTVVLIMWIGEAVKGVVKINIHRHYHNGNKNHE